MDWLWNWFYPKKCVICEERGRFICRKCFLGLRKVDAEVMERDGVCNLFAVLDYRDSNVKKVIKAIKYRLYKGLVKDLMFYIKLDKKLYKTDLIVPIALHRRRENWRGFNQAELIARELSWRLGVKSLRALRRVKETRPLAEIKGRSDREKEIRGAFRIKEIYKEMVKGKKVLLVDDVSTSGATMKEAIKALKDAGVLEVWGFVLAT